MQAKSHGLIDLFRFEPRIRVLHLTWLAFFVSFVIWFNHAPLLAAIRTSLGLTDAEISALLILNVALTIPARIIIIGTLVDRFGPRLVYSALLALSGALCVSFGLAQDFVTLAVTRFFLALVGAGFVVGIRMIAEWFPAKEVGFAQGVYAGLGNFGSPAAGAQPNRRLPRHRDCAVRVQLVSSVSFEPVSCDSGVIGYPFRKIDTEVFRDCAIVLEFALQEPCCRKGSPWAS